MRARQQLARSTPQLASLIKVAMAVIQRLGHTQYVALAHLRQQGAVGVEIGGQGHRANQGAATAADVVECDDILTIVVLIVVVVVTHVVVVVVVLVLKILIFLS